MNILSKLAAVIGLSVLLISCESKNEKIQKEFDKINEKSANEIALKYNAVSDWDLTDKYSFDYEEMFINDKRLMLFKGRICDIAKEDSNYLIKVIDDREREEGQKKYIGYIMFTKKSTANFFKSYKSRTGAFIIQIIKVTTSIPQIIYDADIEDGDAFAYTFLSFDEDKMLTVFKGKLIDYSLDITEENK